MGNTDDEKAGGDFPRYLAAAMIAAGFERPNGEPDVPALSRATGVADPMIRRWFVGTVPTLDSLRAVAPALNLDPRYLFVAAKLLSPREVGLEEAPEPPQARSIEDDIRADPRLTPSRQEALIAILAELTEEHSGRTFVRTRRTRESSDQGIDTAGNEELSG